jgi:hypothetical protein
VQEPGEHARCLRGSGTRDHRVARGAAAVPVCADNEVVAVARRETLIDARSAPAIAPIAGS